MPLKKEGKRIWIAPAALAADQIAKALALKIARPIDLGIVSLIPTVYNTGAAFSIGRNGGWILIALTGVLIIAIAAYLLIGKRISRAERIGLWLTAGGGLGNLIDRLFRPGVVDFISCNLFDFPVFNVGDICVCCGVGIAIIGILIETRQRHE